MTFYKLCLLLAVLVSGAAAEQVTIEPRNPCVLHVTGKRHYYFVPTKTYREGEPVFRALDASCIEQDVLLYRSKHPNGKFEWVFDNDLNPSQRLGYVNDFKGCLKDSKRAFFWINGAHDSSSVIDGLPSHYCLFLKGDFNEGTDKGTVLYKYSTVHVYPVSVTGRGVNVKVIGTKWSGDTIAVGTTISGNDKTIGVSFNDATSQHVYVKPEVPSCKRYAKEIFKVNFLLIKKGTLTTNDGSVTFVASKERLRKGYRKTVSVGDDPLSSRDIRIAAFASINSWTDEYVSARIPKLYYTGLDLMVEAETGTSPRGSNDVGLLVVKLSQHRGIYRYGFVGSEFLVTVSKTSFEGTEKGRKFDLSEASYTDTPFVLLASTSKRSNSTVWMKLTDVRVDYFAASLEAETCRKERVASENFAMLTIGQRSD